MEQISYINIGKTFHVNEALGVNETVFGRRQEQIDLASQLPWRGR